MGVVNVRDMFSAQTDYLSATVTLYGLYEDISSVWVRLEEDSSLWPPLGQKKEGIHRKATLQAGSWDWKWSEGRPTSRWAHTTQQPVDSQSKITRKHLAARREDISEWFPSRLVLHHWPAVARSRVDASGNEASPFMPSGLLNTADDVNLIDHKNPDMGLLQNRRSDVSPLPSSSPAMCVPPPGAGGSENHPGVPGEVWPRHTPANNQPRCGNLGPFCAVRDWCI